MEFIKSWKFMAIIIAVLTVIALVLVFVGVATHHEPGFMPNAVHWQHTPLRVCTTGSTADQCNTLDYAIATTNERLGFTMLQRADDHCDVDVVFGVAVGADGCEEAGGDCTCHADRCVIRLCNDGTMELEQLALQHELGHAIGLDHDDYELSIMRRVQTPTPDHEFPPRISDSDRALIRQTYAE